MGDISWGPTCEEKALGWHRQQIALALAEVKRIELEEQRVWLEAQKWRLAQVALEIDETARKLALAEAKEGQLAWFRDQAEQGAEEMKKLTDFYQQQLDAPTYKKLLARVERTDRAIGVDAPWDSTWPQEKIIQDCYSRASPDILLLRTFRLPSNQKLA